MEQYISKSALVAEIENLLDNGKYHDDYNCVFRDGNNAALYALKGRINTLEVKKVDFEKEIELVKGDYEQVDVAWNNDFDFIARYFFELGMSVSNKAQKKNETLLVL